MKFFNIYSGENSTISCRTVTTQERRNQQWACETEKKSPKCSRNTGYYLRIEIHSRTKDMLPLRDLTKQAKLIYN